MYKALLVDDEALIREAISENIPWEELGFELIASCENGREAMDQIRRTPPELLLTDICMPYVDGIELARYVHENHPDTKTVIISGYDEFEYAKQAVRYQVMEYILKPITPAELTEVLLRAKESLDEKCEKTRTLKKLQGAYISNRPFLRGRFLNSLLKGNERSGGLDEKMAELEISLTGCFFNTAIVEGDDLSPFLNQYKDVRDELALFAICNITQELIERRKLGVAFQNMEEKTVIIFCGDTEEQLGRQADETLKEIQKTIGNLLLIETTVGVGQTVSDVRRLYQSYESAREAMKQKFLMGGGRILQQELLEDPKSNMSIDVSKWAEQVVQEVKSGNEEAIEERIREFAQEIRDSYVNRNRSIIYMQNLLLTIIGTANLIKEKECIIVEEEKTFLNRIYDYEHLTDMAADVTAICIHISKLLGEQRDSYGKKQALMALDYIKDNYMNSEVNLNSVCSHLAISTSYFSTLFKSCTGETFIEALTKKRMEEAKKLLENTSMKTYEVAREVGFSDPHYFSIAFKKATGRTPTEYAKEKRTG
ncbi:MAG: response regulator [Lachnospiraceae bacterium]|jgi:two-component system response regulator YesN|uniref:response regulator n=1 Tax=Candidatus Merdisoma sp. JLR.KK006 TaxID=3112626 RepID=UPI002FF29CFA|nr:response regulator [Lachnospiraceae bacterium]